MDKSKFKELCRRYGTLRVSVVISMILLTTLAAILILSDLVPGFGFVFGMASLIGLFVMGFIVIVYNIVEMVLADDF